VWVRATDRASGDPLSGVTIAAEPEPGLSIAPSEAKTCRLGWAELSATANAHVVGMSLHARGIAKGIERTGDWFGGLPVAGGAAAGGVAEAVPPGKPISGVVLAPPARKVAYVEIDDARGRAFAAALSLEPGVSGVSPDRNDEAGYARAPFEAPALPEGLYWFVTSGDPRGAETLGGAAIARPFVVTSTPGDRCETGPKLARTASVPHTKWIALDGFANRRGRAHQRRVLGLSIAFSSLAIAAMLEVMLVLAGARAPREDITRALEELGEGAAVERVTKRTTVGSVIIGVLVALLGFALLAALLLWRAT
jgi:hypothetical protein